MTANSKLMMNMDEFFRFAYERYAILLARRAGKPKPWTDDRVLQRYYFCNVFREDDRTTEWFRLRIRDPLRNDPRVLLATAVFRWFNLISTGDLIEDLLLGEWDTEKARARLVGKKPLTNGAYIVKSPNGMSKLDGLLWCVDHVVAGTTDLMGRWARGGQKSLHWMWNELQRFSHLGKFMAYEIVTDLRHTYILEEADDIMSWTSAGPGCARGLGWVMFDDPSGYNYTSSKAQSEMLILMRTLLSESKDSKNWPSDWPSWEMREVEHVLCEYDKWKRGCEGQRLKRSYAGC